jgi:hypothetical protein
MEELWNKIGAVVAAMISALGGLYMYDRNNTNSRLSKLEEEKNQMKIDLRVIETQFKELKDDTQEIKDSQKAIIQLLSRRKR